MKTKISILLALFAFALNAQIWNKTFNINGNKDFLSPSFVIGTRDLGSASVSWANNSPTTPRLDYFIVTKQDENGNTIFNNRIFPNNSPKDGFTEVKAMIEMEDKCILIAGYYYYDDSYIMQPFLVKIDANGTYQWTRWYPVNSTDFKGHQFNKISLARVEDDEKENYFIVSCADSDANPDRDEVVNVIKVDADGNLIWTKKYFDYEEHHYSFSNRPGDIAFSKEDKMYMITGWRQEAGRSLEDKMFFFGIDRDGNVVTYFKTLAVPGVPYNQDMVFDPNTRYFAVAFTHGDLDPNVYNFTYSTVGLVTIDANLNVNLHKMYWHIDAKENRGFSISLSESTDYVIGCDTYDGNYRGRNPSLMRVSNTGILMRIRKYNIQDDALFGHHCNTFNRSNGTEGFVLVAENKTDLRVIRTDQDFYTCGERDYCRITEDYDFKEELFKYYPKEIGDIKKYEAKVKELRPKERECSDFNWESYRAANTTGIVTTLSANESGLTIYPSQISLSKPVLTINNPNDADLTLQLLDINGKLVYSKTTIENGVNTLNLSGNSLSEGVYLVKYQDKNGSLSGTQKIIISK
jgi:hypothetical protein